MRTKLLPSILALALLAPTLGANAEEQPPGSPMLHGNLDLSLDQAIAMGLENNLGVQVDRYQPVLAELDNEVAWGAYDPELFGEGGYRNSKSPNTNALFNQNPSNLDRGADGHVGLRGLVPLLSTSYDVRFAGSRAETNSSILALSPEERSSWTIQVNQPLLRDLYWNAPWTQVKVSGIGHRSASEDFRGSIMDTVRDIEDAYWQLIADQEEVRVARKSLETARALLEQTRTQFEVGVVSKVEVTEAEAGVEAREFTQIVAENQYRNQQDVLIDLVMGPGLHAESTLEIQPTDQPEEFTTFEVDVRDSVERAFERRPELAAARLEVERTEVQQQFAWNQRLPALDAVVTYGNEGAAGDQNPRFDPCRFIADDPSTPVDERAQCNANPPNVGQGNFGNTFDDYDDNPQFTVRGVLSMPIPNTAARRTYDRRVFEVKRARTQLRQLEQRIILEVRRSARNLQASQEGIQSAERATEAAQEQLRAEEIRHEYGEATPFDVLQREEDLVDREVERIEAFRAYRSSATALDRAQGTILRSRNIRIEEVSTLR